MWPLLQGKRDPFNGDIASSCPAAQCSWPDSGGQPWDQCLTPGQGRRAWCFSCLYNPLEVWLVFLLPILGWGTLSSQPGDEALGWALQGRRSSQVPYWWQVSWHWQGCYPGPPSRGLSRAWWPAGESQREAGTEAMGGLLPGSQSLRTPDSPRPFSDHLLAGKLGWSVSQADSGNWLWSPEEAGLQLYLVEPQENPIPVEPQGCTGPQGTGRYKGFPAL